MDDYIDVTIRPAPMGAAAAMGIVAAWTGIVLVGLWAMRDMPGLPLLVLSPVLAACLVPVIGTRVYGLRVGARHWTVLTGRSDQRVAVKDIAYLGVVPGPGCGRAAPGLILVLKSGRELPLPATSKDRPLALIRAATDRGIPVRLR